MYFEVMLLYSALRFATLSFFATLASPPLPRHSNHAPLQRALDVYSEDRRYRVALSLSSTHTAPVKSGWVQCGAISSFSSRSQD